MTDTKRPVRVESVTLTAGLPRRSLLWLLVSFMRARGPYARGSGWLWRNVMRRLLAGVDLRVKFESGTECSQPADTKVALALLMTGDFELREAEYLLAQLREPGDVLVDVGANIGLHSVRVAKAAPASLIRSVEPHSATAARLRKNVRECLLPNVEVLEMALMSETGTGTWTSASGDTSLGSVHSSPDGEVAFSTLDDICADLLPGQPRVVKVDVEGAEIEVLLGGPRLLSEVRPILILEAVTPDSYNALERHLLPLGYRLEQPHGFLTWNFAAIPSKPQ